MLTASQRQHADSSLLVVLSHIEATKGSMKLIYSPGRINKHGSCSGSYESLAHFLKIFLLLTHVWSSSHVTDSSGGFCAHISRMFSVFWQKEPPRLQVNYAVRVVNAF